MHTSVAMWKGGVTAQEFPETFSGGIPMTYVSDRGRSSADGNNGVAQASRSDSRRESGRRGFASMDPERQREIASKGGKAAHQKGTAHHWTAEEAREAGRKGGHAVSRDRKHMAAIGRAVS
jgi:general stress protein YciG